MAPIGVFEPTYTQWGPILRIDTTCCQYKNYENRVEIVASYLVREKFERSCSLFLSREYPKLNAGGVASVIRAMHWGLVQAYERRGMEIARSVFSDDVVDLSDATDILESINSGSSGLAPDCRAAYADLTIEVMLRPGRR